MGNPKCCPGQVEQGGESVANVTDWAIDPTGLDEGDSSRDGEKGPDSGPILKTELM